MIEPTTNATTPPIPSAPKLGRNASDTMKRDAQQDESQTGIADGQHLEGIQREQQADAADDTRQYITGIPKFKKQPVDTEQHQNISDVRVGNDGEQAAAPVGFVRVNLQARGLESDVAALDVSVCGRRAS